MIDVETVIIGAGIHGSTLGLLLDDVMLLDPRGGNIASWRELTEKIGVTYLRSPSVHNIAPIAREIQAYATHSKRGGKYMREVFIKEYGRPLLQLFNDFSEIYLKNLEDKIQQVEATRIYRDNGIWRVDHSEGSIGAQSVVLAMGSSGNLNIPEWAEELQAFDLPVYHVFSPEYSIDKLPDGGNILVVGGGMSAGQLAQKLFFEEYEVTIVTKEDFVEAHFDAHQCYLGQKCLNHFWDLPYDERRKLIAHERKRGTMTYDVLRPLEVKINGGAIGHVISTDDPWYHGDNIIFNGQVYDAIVLATGYSMSRPGGSMIDNLILEHGLEVASDGYPIAPHCQWSTGLYVMGPLADLELGPFASNIWGAQRAAASISEQIEGDEI